MKSMIPTCQADLNGMECIARVSSEMPEKRNWTVLSLWYDRGASRPFVSVIEGRVRGGETTSTGRTMVERFRAVTSGTMDRAINVFESSDLAAQLVGTLGCKAGEIWPDVGTVQQDEAEARRAARFYQGGVSFTAALAWLYPDHVKADASDNQLGQLFEADFGVAARTVRNLLTDERAGKPLSSWALAFLSLLDFADGKAWHLRAADRPRRG